MLVNVLCLSCTEFCIYTYTVNSNFTTWHVAHLLKGAWIWKVIHKILSNLYVYFMCNWNISLKYGIRAWIVSFLSTTEKKDHFTEYRQPILSTLNIKIDTFGLRFVDLIHVSRFDLHKSKYAYPYKKCIKYIFFFTHWIQAYKLVRCANRLQVKIRFNNQIWILWMTPNSLIWWNLDNGIHKTHVIFNVRKILN